MMMDDDARPTTTTNDIVGECDLCCRTLTIEVGQEI